MEKSINVKIDFDNLAEAPNHHRLAVLLEEEIQDAVSRALAAAFDSSGGIDFTVHVPSF